MEVGPEGLQGVTEAHPAKPGWKLLPADLSGQSETKTMAGVRGDGG